MEQKSINQVSDAHAALEAAIKEVVAKGFGEVRIIIQNKVIKRVVVGKDTYRVDDC